MKVFRLSARMGAVLCLAALASCSSGSDKHTVAPETIGRKHAGMQNTGPTLDTDGPAMACPQEAVLQQAQSLTTFLPGRSDVAAQVTTAQITGIAGDCQLTHNNKVLLVKLQAGFSATNGPANNGAPVVLPWFVALTQGDQIIQEQDYTVKLNFDGNASMAQAVSPTVKMELPNIPASSQVQILVGFKSVPGASPAPAP
jgi:hypothetical protein